MDINDVPVVAPPGYDQYDSLAQAIQASMIDGPSVVAPQDQAADAPPVVVAPANPAFNSIEFRDMQHSDRQAVAVRAPRKSCRQIIMNGNLGYTWQICLITLLVTLIVIWNMALSDQKKELEVLKEYWPKQYAMIGMNFTFYYVSLGLAFVSLGSNKFNNNCLQKCFSTLVFVWNLAIIGTFFMLIPVAYDPTFHHAVEGRFKDLKNLETIIQAMVQVRLATLYWVVVSTCLMFSMLYFKGRDQGYAASYEADHMEPMLGRQNSWGRANSFVVSNPFTRRRDFLLKHLHSYNAVEDHGIECNICMCNFEDDLTKEIVQMECFKGHIFHKDCIVNWAKEHDTCPDCRAKF